MSGSSPIRMAFPPLPDRPLVSVLMPAFNAALFVERSVRSIFDQSYPHWELLILDDGSTDGTGSLIDGLDDARIRKFRNEENAGYLRASNRLFAEAKGDLITFLDADDTCIAERLALCIAAFRADAALGFLTTDHVKADASGTVISEHRAMVDYERYATDPDYCPTVCCATTFFRKELLDKVGGYDPFFDRMGGEDYHWLFQLSRQAAGRHLPTKTYAYTTHAKQTQWRNAHQLNHFMIDIDRELRTQCIHGLPSGLEDPLALQARWENHVRQHPYELTFRIASSDLNHGHRLKALAGAFRIVAASPWQAMAWKRAAYLVYSLVRRVIASSNNR